MTRPVTAPLLTRNLFFPTTPSESPQPEIRTIPGPSTPRSREDRKTRPIREGRCENCGCDERATSLWRTAQQTVGELSAGKMLCNACGLYVTEHKQHRPRRYWGKTRKSQSRSRSCSTQLYASSVDQLSPDFGPLDPFEHFDQLDVLDEDMGDAAATLLAIRRTTSACGISDSLQRLNPSWLTPTRSAIVVVPPPGLLEPPPKFVSPAGPACSGYRRSVPRGALTTRKVLHLGSARHASGSIASNQAELPARLGGSTCSCSRGKGAEYASWQADI